MPLAAGTKLESYEILELLGAGGMGEVYRALDPALKREVAIKILPASVSRDPDRLRRFEQEAQAAARLNHPNILAVYHFGVFGDAPYLVSELLAGESLGQVLQRGSLPMRKAIDYAVQVTHGLTAAHNHGIVHRDLKPDNLFVSRDGRVKILDFGLAKLKAEPVEAEPEGNPQTRTIQTNPGVVMGTAAYMSPEQVRGQAVDHHTDIFALGCILYEMVTGKRAFQRPISVETMSAILNEDAPSLAQARAGAPLPPALQRVINRCLEKNPEQRFHSASDLAFSLEAMSDTGAVPLALTPAPEHKRAWPQRVWLIAAAGVVLAVALAYAALTLRSTAPPLRVVDYVNLSKSGHAGDVQDTDGARIYLENDDSSRLEQISTSGGGISPVFPVTLPQFYMSEISPDGSAFLAVSRSISSVPPDKGVPFYIVPFLGGSYRYLVQGFSACWSPDGKKVAYSTGNEINIVNGDGTEAHKIATLGFRAFYLRWSPDGSLIRFSEGASSLWEISSNGANLHQLLPNWHPSERKYDGRWSPDGDFYAFVARNRGEQESSIYYLDERRGLFRKSAEQPFRLAVGPIEWGSPVFSRDGKTVFASGKTSRGELVRFGFNSDRFEPFLDGLSADSVAFSKDGKYIAYITRSKRSLWRANRDGSNPVSLTTPPFVPLNAEWSPDSARILFGASSSSEFKAWVVSSQGGTPEQLIPQSPGNQFSPRWSPDGTRVMYEAGSDFMKMDIFIFDLATHELAKVAGSEGTHYADWSPDGSMIAAARISDISVFDTRTKHWSKLCGQLTSTVAWSRDSRQIYYLDASSEKAGFYRIPVTGGEPQLIAGAKGFHFSYESWFDLDPTDAPLLLKNTSTRDVYALKLERH